MHTALIDIGVGAVIFVAGIVLTIRRFATKDRTAMIVMALLTPPIAVYSVFRVAFLAIAGRSEMNPCPPGLEVAERAVELRRQEMFGGKMREPSFTYSWQQAYGLELQRETDRLQRFALRHLRTVNH